MIKKLIGIVVAAAVVAIIVIAALHHKNYRSMVFRSGHSAQELAEPVTPTGGKESEAVGANGEGEASPTSEAGVLPDTVTTSR